MEHPGRTPRNFNFSLHKWSDPAVPEVNNSIGTSFDLAGGCTAVDPGDPRPKEFVVDYFRAYRKA
ncbi:hypothetical protein [Amycolatopsis sp. MtRt-6]|uniref:hypothetical protein n=1 Tax=Amycolatopsis sp. MtRt-6 TaxID=2792782 RepID=UPI001A8E804B|nr:hypothetical protein [Amycolatopsis sp. MtRt-6]